ncbi:DUF3231 family protein [Lentibacillus salicampi]|nr:DUF3231 family protein [Lentibacillus salicampi]
MGNEPTVKLTSAELSQVWTSYQNDTASICILNIFYKRL